MMNDPIKYEYFEAYEEPLLPGRKTHIYRLVNVRSGATLGCVQYNGSWRQFCFFPYGITTWSKGCLADVNDLIAKVTKMRTQEKKEASDE